MGKCQLAKGKQGEVRADALYYWSTDGQIYDYPDEQFYPVYRTTLERKHKQGNICDF